MKRSLVRIAAIALIVMTALALGACRNEDNTLASGSVDPDTAAQLAASSAQVKVAGYDPFTIELHAADAPATVLNFCYLASDGYYNGLAFYRIVPGFCLQGGTAGNTASGDDESIRAIQGEFSSNGVDNKLADDFKRGVVAMARTQAPDSAKSTFFITLASDETVAASLNGQYAAFGTIDEAGMAIVDKIVADYTQYASGDMGVIADEAHMPVIESITLTD